VLVISSATHLLMEGLSGYVTDLVRELKKIDTIFRGGIIATPGIPIFLGGCGSPEVIRDLWDMMGWLKHIGKLELKKGWTALMESFIGGGGGVGFQGYRKSRNRLPDSLRSYATRSWVSPGGTTLYNEVPPVSTDLEKRIVTGLLKDLNGLYDLGLGTNPALARKMSSGKPKAKPNLLIIGGSNAGRTADEFEERGYTVTRICSPGWKPTSQAVQDILPKVTEALSHLEEDDVILIQALDNAAYYSQTEDGGDVPIRRCADNKYHVEGNLGLASKERQQKLFSIIEPLLRLLDKRRVILVTPMPRWMYESCCSMEDHAPNRTEDGFEENMRAALRDFRINFKNFAFLRNFRIKVLDPSPCLALVDDNGEDVWGSDPVHPLPHGFRLLVDMFEVEIENLKGKSKKRAGSNIQPPAKRSKPAPRPAWISQQTSTAIRREHGGLRGGRGERGRPPYRGRGGRSGGGSRG
jgi:hypothetical protein